jgi:uncharacterized protein
VRAAAETFRANPSIDTVKAITELGKGEALVSFLEGNGTPSVVERCLICPPTARVGPVSPEERNAVIAKSPLRGKYDTAVDDPESAFERLQKRVDETVPAGSGRAGTPQTGDAQQPAGEESGGIGGMLGSIFGISRKRGQRLSTTQVIAREVTRSVTNKVVGQVAADIGKSIAGSMGGSVGRAIVRGALGGILRR